MSQRLLWILKKDKEKLENKKKDVKAKVKEISAKEESLQASLNTALLCQEDLEKVVSDLIDEQVSTFGVSFKHANNVKLVDKETIASLKSPFPIEDSCVNNGAMDYGESKVPQPWNFFEEVVTQEEE
ncbi:hypothetical protein RYX36_012328 [Vicia faba]